MAEIVWFNFVKDGGITNLKYMHPDSKLPKFKIGQKVLLVNYYIDLNNNYINYPSIHVNYDILNEFIGKPLTIENISYNITNNIIYYSFNETGEFLGEVALQSIVSKYNEPRKLVYENIMSYKKYNKKQ